jgi:hypothetical protein
MLRLAFLFGDKHVDIENLAYLVDELADILEVTDQANATDYCNSKFCV